jgi:hypothetical protein
MEIMYYYLSSLLKSESKSDEISLCYFILPSLIHGYRISRSARNSTKHRVNHNMSVSSQYMKEQAPAAEQHKRLYQAFEATTTDQKRLYPSHASRAANAYHGVNIPHAATATPLVANGSRQVVYSYAALVSGTAFDPPAPVALHPANDSQNYGSYIIVAESGSMDITIEAVQTIFPRDPVPTMHKNGPAAYFVPGPWQINAMPFPNGTPSPEAVNLATDNTPLRQVLPQAFQEHQQKLNSREMQYVSQVRRWIRTVILKGILTEHQQKHWNSELVWLGIHTQELWETKKNGHAGFRKQAIFRLQEIIYGVLQESRQYAARQTSMELTRGMVEMTLKYSNIDTTRLRHRQDPTDYLRGSVSCWKKLREFCQLLCDDFGEDAKRLWSPIVQMHYGISVDRLSTPEFWENIEKLLATKPKREMAKISSEQGTEASEGEESD